MKALPTPKTSDPMQNDRTTARLACVYFVMFGFPPCIRNDGHFRPDEFFDAPTFEQERGVASVADALPDLELSFADPAQKGLARNAEFPTRFGTIQYQFRVHK